MDNQRNIEISPEKESLENKHGENLNSQLNQIGLKDIVILRKTNIIWFFNKMGKLRIKKMNSN